MVSAPNPRRAELGLADHGDAAIDLLVGLIADAVTLSDDQRVGDLDQVLRHIERMVEMSDLPSGSTVDRSMARRRAKLDLD